LQGEYGINSELLDVEDHEVSYTRAVSDAEMMPFYFLAAVPRHGTKALIALEVGGSSAIKLQFQDGFETFIRGRCQACDLEIERLVPEELLNSYFQDARVTKLRFVRFKVPADIADAFREGVSEEVTLELRWGQAALSQQ
jgi:hypothetical protein